MDLDEYFRHKQPHTEFLSEEDAEVPNSVQKVVRITAPTVRKDTVPADTSAGVDAGTFIKIRRPVKWLKAAQICDFSAMTFPGCEHKSVN